MKMNRTDIMNQLKEILLSADPGSREKIENGSESSRLVEDFGLSSVNILYMVIFIEEAFGIRFENVGVTSFATLGDVVDYIEEKLQ